MIQKNEPISTKDFDKGLVTRSKIIENNPNQSPNCMDIKWFFDGAIGKRYGASSTNSVTIGSSGVSAFSVNSTGTLVTGLQDWWKLEESSGTRADQYGLVPLAELGSVGYIVGIRNQAALFVAGNTSGLVGSASGSVLTGNVNFSMAAWVYLNSTSLTVERSVISKRDSGTTDSQTVLLLHCDGTNGSTSFPDSSASNHTVTAHASAKVDTSQSEFGGASCRLASATGDYLTANNTADFNMGSGDFTIDFWIRFNTVQAGDFWGAFNAGGYAFITETTGGRGLNLCDSGTTANGLFVAWTPSANTWYHVACVRSGNSVYFFVNGTQQGATKDCTGKSYNTNGADPWIGKNTFSGSYIDGWVDEVRISKGIARWTSNFTPPVNPYGYIAMYEYFLSVDTTNKASFSVSSTNTNATVTLQATSFGALNTATWYNLVAWHSNNSHVGISVNLAWNTAAYVGGVKAGSANFTLGAISGSTTNFLDARMDEVGFWNKVLTTGERNDLYGGGTGNTFTGSSSAFGWAMFDFGATNIRWLTVAQGSGIVASSNLGTTFVTIATSRTQQYQYLDRSKNVLIATSDAYDVPLYWVGSAGTFAATLAPNSAPGVKYSINYNGFLLLMNANGSPRTVYYANENTQLTDPYTNNFTLPSSADDEITSVFILYRYLYISTRYKLFRVAFAGGNPDWLWLKVKDWGYVPRTAKLVTIKGNQVVVGMDWQRRLRIFDGFDDMFVSDNVENDNNYCDFAMSKISYAGSGLIVSNAEFDTTEQEYRLNVAIGSNSTNTTHAIVLNGRTLAMYPYSNQQYQTICIAESNSQQHLMALDRSGFVHILNSGNMDNSSPINEVYDSPLLFQQSPTQVQKSQQLNLYFKVTSCGTISYRDRVDLSNQWNAYKPFTDNNGNTQITGNESYLQALRTVDLPGTYNTYQFSIGSTGTANPWKLTHWEFLQASHGIGRGV